MPDRLFAALARRFALIESVHAHAHRCRRSPPRDVPEDLGDLLGDSRRKTSFATYALGLLGEGDRKIVEPIAARRRQREGRRGGAPAASALPRPFSSRALTRSACNASTPAPPERLPTAMDAPNNDNPEQPDSAHIDSNAVAAMSALISFHSTEAHVSHPSHRLHIHCRPVCHLQPLKKNVARMLRPARKCANSKVPWDGPSSMASVIAP